MIGRQIDSYKIVKELGNGGFGTVYLGENILDSSIKVALKIANQQLSKDTVFVEALKKEYRLLNQLHHSQIVRFQGLSQIDGQLVLIMEYLEGEELKDRLKRGKLSISESFRIVTEVLKGLEHTHSQDIIHRDIKPANIFLCRDGRVKLLDFGISKAMGKTSTGQSSQMLSGTLDYMPPERFNNESGCYTDIYAVGLVLWEMLSGKTACEGDGLVAKMGWHVNKGAPNIRDCCPELTEGQADFVMRMCEKDPQKRPQDGKEALALLESLSRSETKRGKGGTEVLDRKEVEKVVLGNQQGSSDIQQEEQMPNVTDIDKKDTFQLGEGKGDTVAISKNEIEDVVVEKKGGKGKWFVLGLVLLGGGYFYVESEKQAKIEAERKAELDLEQARGRREQRREEKKQEIEERTNRKIDVIEWIEEDKQEVLRWVVLQNREVIVIQMKNRVIK